MESGEAKNLSEQGLLAMRVIRHDFKTPLTAVTPKGSKYNVVRGKSYRFGN